MCTTQLRSQHTHIITHTHSHVREEEGDQVRRHKIKDRVLDMYFRHSVSVSKVENVMRSYYLVEGVLWRVSPVVTP